MNLYNIPLKKKRHVCSYRQMASPRRRAGERERARRRAGAARAAPPAGSCHLQLREAVVPREAPATNLFLSTVPGVFRLSLCDAGLTP